MTASIKTLLEPILSPAINQAALLPASGRAEYIGLTLIARADEVCPPQAPELQPGEDPPVLAPSEAAELISTLEAAYKHAVTRHGDSNLQVGDVMRTVGAWLCPKAGAIPPDAFTTLYTKCEDIPYIVQVDAFLFFPGPEFHFSHSRGQEAKRQSWKLIRGMHEKGKCDRLILMAGNPAVGKSTWIEKVGPQEPGVETSVFFDDLLNNRRRRNLWWEAYRASGLSLRIEIVAIVRNFERSLASNEARGAKGGIYVPSKTMDTLSSEYEAPSVEEGFVRVRIFENQHDENTGEGGYVLKHEELAEPQGTRCNLVP